MKQYEPHSSSLGNASANLIAALCCALSLMFSLPGIAVSLVLGYLEKKSGLVKYYAAAAAVLGAARFVVTRIFDGAWAISAPVNIAALVLLVLMGLSAYRWKEMEIPLVSKWARGLKKALFGKAKYEGDGPVPDDCRQGGAVPGEGPASTPPPAPPQIPAGNSGPSINLKDLYQQQQQQQPVQAAAQPQPFAASEAFAGPPPAPPAPVATPEFELTVQPTLQQPTDQE